MLGQLAPCPMPATTAGRLPSPRTPGPWPTASSSIPGPEVGLQKANNGSSKEVSRAAQPRFLSDGP